MAEPRLPAALLDAPVTWAPTPGEPATDGLGLLERLGPADRLRVWADQDRAVVWSDMVGHIAVDAGTAVTVHPGAKVEPSYLEAYLYGLVATLVAGQQRRFALHASTVAHDGARVALAGFRGAGKTTTSLAMVARGAEAVADDLTIADLDAGRVVTRSIGRPLHVWPDTLRKVRVDLDGVHGTGEGGKLTIPWADAGPGPLAALVVLARAEVDGPQLRRLEGATAVAAVHAQTSWQAVVEQLWPAEVFAWRAAVADTLPVWELRRPAEGWPLDDLCERIESLVG